MGKLKLMFENNRVVFILFIAGIAVFAAAVIHSNGKDNDRLQNSYMDNSELEKNNIFVKMRFPNCRQARKDFGYDLCKKGIQPVIISINNKSPTAYYFKKIQVGSHYIPAELSMIKCEEKQLLKRFMPLFFKKINASKRHNYLSKEIADDFIYSNQEKSGFMFLTSLKNGEEFVIPLINKETGQKLLFGFTIKERVEDAGRY